MRLNPAASESGSRLDQPQGSRSVEQPGLSEAHVRRITELFRDEYAKLVHYLVARTRSWPDARDIAAQAFAQVLEMRDPGAVSFLKAYVYRAARNLATDRARSGAIRRRISEAIYRELESTTPSPEPLFMQQERLRVLEQALGALRPTRKMVLKWRMWEELPYAVIESRFAAEGIVVSERTVNRWYADGLKELRQAIQAAEESREERRDVHE